MTDKEFKKVYDSCDTYQEIANVLGWEKATVLTRAWEYRQKGIVLVPKPRTISKRPKYSEKELYDQYLQAKAMRDDDRSLSYIAKKLGYESHNSAQWLLNRFKGEDA